MARKPREAAYTHDATRTHIPESGFVDYAKPPKQPTKSYCFDPHESPQLVWAGKAGLRRVEVDEEASLEVPVVNLHIHERISAEGILRAVRREDAQRSLFADPDLEFKDDIRYYEHQVGWSNRMVLGDSLLVMNSLLEREGMRGQVQCIYMDPPYGIKYASNFQPRIDQRDVKDGKDEDLTREVMQVQAFRDTWELGVHSYLTYLRDRLLLARELLKDEGSIFVQIGDENVHRVRCLMDEVFGEENFIGQISMTTKIPLKQLFIAGVNDYILWFAKSREQCKYRQVYGVREIEADPEYTLVELPNGQNARVGHDQSDQLPPGSRRFRRVDFSATGYGESTDFPFDFEGGSYRPSNGKSWKTNRDGMRRAAAANRVVLLGGRPYYKGFLDDFPVTQLTNVWTDTTGGFTEGKMFAVQTPPKVIERCILMTTDPGDLVLDPTCGSGTTAYVAEQWGRRWITMDTSRVALAIARHRLMTAAFDYYKLRHPTSGVSGGFVYKTVPHITLKSIAQNTEIDAIAAKYQTQIDEALAKVNQVFGKSWKDWEVPRPPKSEPPTADRQLLTDFWTLKRAMQAEIDASIARNAPTEELVDQPEKERGIVRVTGPFSMEAVPNVGAEISMHVEEATIDDMSVTTFAPRTDDTPTARNVNAYLGDMIAKLAKTGVVAKGGKKLAFSALRAIEHAVLHAEGEIENGETRRVGVLFGPQNGSISESHVKDALAAGRRYDVLLLCGYDFTPTAQEMAQAASGGDWQVLLAYVAPDTVMTDLLKDTKASQLFTMIGEPDVVVYRHGDPSLPELLANAASRGATDVAARAEQMQPGEMFLELKGVDLYDPLSGEVKSDAGQNVHAVFVDQDYDGKSFCICQALFPNKKDSWTKIAKNLKGAIDEDAFEAFRTLVCLPFKPGVSFDREKGEGRVQVKVVDQRGNAVVKTIRP